MGVFVFVYVRVCKFVVLICIGWMINQRHGILQIDLRIKTIKRLDQDTVYI